MTTYLLKRVPSALLTLLLASIAIFMLVHLLPGSAAAAIAGPDATPSEVRAVTTSLGLDRPLPIQYLTWIRGIVTGHFGYSYVIGAAIGQLISQAAGNTLELALAAMLLSLGLGGTFGILGALTRRRAVRAFLAALNTVTFAVPTFVTGVLFILVFAVIVPIFPPSGHVSLLANPIAGLHYLLMPAACLALPLSAVISRFLQASLNRVLDEDYMRTAVAKGLRAKTILFIHAIPNALPPVLTILGIQMGQLLGGAVVVEVVFAWPGLGRLVVQAVEYKDYLLVQDILLIAVTVFIGVQIITDLLYATLDPRIRKHLVG